MKTIIIITLPMLMCIGMQAQEEIILEKELYNIMDLFHQQKTIYSIGEMTVGVNGSTVFIMARGAKMGVFFTKSINHKGFFETSFIVMDGKNINLNKMSNDERRLVIMKHRVYIIASLQIIKEIIGMIRVPFSRLLLKDCHMAQMPPTYVRWFFLIKNIYFANIVLYRYNNGIFTNIAIRCVR